LLQKFCYKGVTFFIFFFFLLQPLFSIFIEAEVLSLYMATELLRLSHPMQVIEGSISLPASKSESNRALILKALCGNRAHLENVSEARDTQTMLRLLESREQVLDVLDAGTTMRFLTAYLSVTGQQKILTGTPRMQQRPIGILVDALRSLGADIENLKAEGYAPIQLNGFSYNGTRHIQIQGDISSQYISALLMAAPLLPEGLQLELAGKVASRPYIEMTLQQMAAFGVEAYWEGHQVVVPPGQYQPVHYVVESDWSAASYWYSLVSLAKEADITLLGLREESLQGDRQMARVMEALGVHSEFLPEGVRLSKRDPLEAIEIDFSDCPDLAQTLSVLCGAKGITLILTGIESLRIKETDRINALQTELAKCGISMAELESQPGTFQVKQAMSLERIGRPVRIHTYEDHRMAMAFAPLALLRDILIEEPGVVVKSYPRFWHDLSKTGFRIEKVIEKK
jgi:3-phosphoshikimate 1-carboxyvinyltransferase